MSFRDSFVIYGMLRPAVLFGVRINPVIRALGAEPGERILDAGCGYGVLVKYFKHCDYTGVDLDPERVQWARLKFGETKSRRFVVGDVSHMDFPSKSFDRAIGFGILHHLSDAAALQTAQELSRLSRQNVVFADPVYSKHHIVSNFLCRHDRGDHVRDAGGYLRVCEPAMRAVRGDYYLAYSGVAKYFLMSCEAAPASNLIASEA